MAGSLKEYNKKRDFKQTAEPAGKSSKTQAAKQLVFVVQRHYATRLHYDFRLEINSTLKSWAVPKGPSLNPDDRRLAVMVEDHPYDYKDFYGSIPEGNYGGGEVEIWDEGFYFPVDEDHQPITEAQAQKNLDKGELKVLLAGTHLQGEFVLVRLKKDDKNWLLIKHKDDYSTTKEYDIAAIGSVKSKEKKAQPAAAKKEAKKVAKPAKEMAEETSTESKATSKKNVKKKAVGKKTNDKKAPGKTQVATNKKSVLTQNKKAIKSIKPMLASTSDKAFDSEEWLFENKWDGYRAIAIKSGDDIQLLSRNELSFNAKFPAIVNAIAASIDHNVVLDGEVIAIENGKISFQALQHAADVKPVLQYCIFDLLYLDGHSVMNLPLTDRKKLLEQLLKNAGNKMLLYSTHVLKGGKSFFDEIKKKGLEGIMAKKINSLYTPNVRSQDWLKIKNRNDREAIIVGYTAGRGSRSFFGALILAEKMSGGYAYIGHTGTGFSEASLKELFNTMQSLVTDKSPFAEKIKVNAPVTWLTPKLVCTVYFTEATKDGILRHPVFAGLRPDKAASEVKKESKSQSSPKQKNG